MVRKIVYNSDMRLKQQKLECTTGNSNELHNKLKSFKIILEIFQKK